MSEEIFSEDTLELSYEESFEYDGFTIESGFGESQGKRETMEDAHICIDNAHTLDYKLNESLANKKIAFYGVFDGHGGVETANFVKEHLSRNILLSDEFKDGDIEKAIHKGFELTDSSVVAKSDLEGWMNGSTAVIGIIVDEKLYIANIGDSEACLVSDIDGNLLIQELTVIHKASSPEEKKRIESLGGHVFFGRVFGTLAVSRSFGDSKFKKPKTTENFVTWEPEISNYELTPSHKFLILACDGLWDVMSHEDAAKFVSEQRKSGKSANEICKALVNEALRKKTEDNVTIIIVFFNWQKKEEQ